MAKKPRKPSKSELKKIIKKDDSAITRAASDVQKTLSDVVKGYRKEVEILILQNSPSKAGLQRIVDIVQLTSDLRDALNASGLPDVTKEFHDKFPGIEKRALEFTKAFNLPASMSGTSIEALNAHIIFGETRLRELVDARLVAPIRNEIIAANLGNRSRLDVLANVRRSFDALRIKTAKGLEFSDNQINSLLNESFIEHSRLTNDLKSRELDLDIGVYLGPEDESNSVQCKFILNLDLHGAPGFLRREEWTAKFINSKLKAAGHKKKSELLNASPLIQGGHYNCRHHVRFVTLEYAQSEGWNE